MAQTCQPARNRVIVAWVVAALLVGVVLALATEVLLLVFAAVLLAVFLHGPSDWLAAHSKLSQRWALVIVIVTLIGVVGGLARLIAPHVADQVDRLAETLPPLLRHYASRIEQFRWGEWFLSNTPSLGEMSGSMGRFLATVGGFFSTTIGVVVNLALVGVLGIYLAAEADSYREGLVTLLPPDKRDRAREVLSAIAATIRGWLLGQLFSMTFLGVFAFIGLSLLGIPLALTLALFTALLTFIPNLGPIISVIFPLLLALAESPWLALYVLLFYIVLQSSEGYFFTPMAMKFAVRLPPALLLTMQIVLALLFGFFGLVLAAPLVAVGLALVKLLYLENVLGEQVSLPGYEGRSRNRINTSSLVREEQR